MTEMGGMSDVVLHWHLTGNHFPPLLGALTFARLAIEAVEQGDPTRVVRDGSREGIAECIVRDWHLEDFLTDEAVAS
jgi:hypothetical protein